MEVSLLTSAGLPEGCLLSVRSGSTRRQAPADPKKLRLSFPKGIQYDQIFKVDILAPLGSAEIKLKPGQDAYEVVMPPSLGATTDYNITLKVKGEAAAGAMNEKTRKPVVSDNEADKVPSAKPGTAPKTPGPGLNPAESTLLQESPSQRHRLALAAQTYLDQHELLPWLQGLLQDLIHDRPQDPWDYIGQHKDRIKDLMATKQSLRKTAAAHEKTLLGEAPAEATSKVDDLRREVQASLLAASRSGKLTDALNSVQGGQELDVEALRKKARETLQSANLNQALLGATVGAKEVDVEALREQARVTLMASCKSGVLTQALSSVKDPAEEAAPANKEAGQVKALLLGAGVNTLDKVLAEVHISDKVAASLTAACKDGSLTSALTKTWAPEPADSVSFMEASSAADCGMEDEIRKTMLTSLQNFHVAGSAVASEVIETHRSQTGQEMDLFGLPLEEDPDSNVSFVEASECGVEDEIRETMMTSLQSFHLAGSAVASEVIETHRSQTGQEIIRGLFGEEADVDIEGLRLKTREMLVEASLTGTLRNMMQTAKEQAEGSPSQIEDIRVLAKRRLLQASATGDLSSALRQVRPALSVASAQTIGRQSGASSVENAVTDELVKGVMAAVEGFERPNSSSSARTLGRVSGVTSAEHAAMDELVKGVLEAVKDSERPNSSSSARTLGRQSCGTSLEEAVTDKLVQGVMAAVRDSERPPSAGGSCQTVGRQASHAMTDEMVQNVMTAVMGSERPASAGSAEVYTVGRQASHALTDELVRNVIGAVMDSLLIHATGTAQTAENAVTEDFVRGVVARVTDSLQNQRPPSAGSVRTVGRFSCGTSLENAATEEVVRGVMAAVTSSMRTQRPLSAASAETIEMSGVTSLENAVTEEVLRGVMERMSDTMQNPRPPSAGSIHTVGRASCGTSLENAATEEVVRGVVAAITMPADEVPEEEVQDEADQVREEVLGLFVQASGDGSLTQAMASAHGLEAALAAEGLSLPEAAQVEDLALDELDPDQLRLQAKSLLAQASGDGSLARLVTEMAGPEAIPEEEPAQASEDQLRLEEIRKEAKKVLFAAASNGDLANILPAPAAKGANLEAVRLEARKALTAAAVHGDLMKELTMAAAEVSDMEAIREKAQAALAKAAGEGSLTQAVHGAFARPKSAGMEAIREKARLALAKAADDGRLTEVVRDAFAPRSARTMENLRLKAQDALLAASDNGELGSVLHSVAGKQSAAPFGQYYALHMQPGAMLASFANLHAQFSRSEAKEPAKAAAPAPAEPEKAAAPKAAAPAEPEKAAAPAPVEPEKAAVPEPVELEKAAAPKAAAPAEPEKAAAPAPVEPEKAAAPAPAELAAEPAEPEKAAAEKAAEPAEPEKAAAEKAAAPAEPEKAAAPVEPEKAAAEKAAAPAETAAPAEVARPTSSQGVQRLLDLEAALCAEGVVDQAEAEQPEQTMQQSADLQRLLDLEAEASRIEEWTKADQDETAPAAAAAAPTAAAAAPPAAAAVPLAAAAAAAAPPASKSGYPLAPKEEAAKDAPPMAANVEPEQVKSPSKGAPLQGQELSDLEARVQARNERVRRENEALRMGNERLRKLKEAAGTTDASRLRSTKDQIRKDVERLRQVRTAELRKWEAGKPF